MSANGPNCDGTLPELIFAADALDSLSDDDRARFLAALTDAPDTIGVTRTRGAS